MAAPVLIGVADRRSLDIRLVSGGVHGVSGVVEAREGSGKINIVVEKEEPASFTMVASGNIAGPGAFHIENLSEGNFTILAFTDGDKNQRQFWSIRLTLAAGMWKT